MNLEDTRTYLTIGRVTEDRKPDGSFTRGGTVLYAATTADGGVADLERVRPGSHPRSFGAFPRKIAVYVKDRGVISLPFAIRSMSGLGARIIGLPDRGFLREGQRADVVVFSLERIRDQATIMDPGQPSEGIDYVLVNGQFAIDNGEPTGALAGRVLIR